MPLVNLFLTLALIVGGTAPPSDVANAAEKGDKAALRALLFEYSLLAYKHGLR